MSDSLYYRLIGLAILIPGFVWLYVSPDLSEGIDMLLAFLAGACLGAGGSLLVTGEPLWDSRTWWASKPPQKRW